MDSPLATHAEQTGRFVVCALLDEALEQSASDPKAVIAKVEEIIGTRELLPPERSVAHHALGLAHRELDELPEACVQLQLAVDAARECGSVDLEGPAQARLSLAFALRGDNAGALEAIGRAEQLQSGYELAHSRSTRAMILQRMGRYDEATEIYGDVLPVLLKADDVSTANRVRVNWGIVLGTLGRLDEADEVFLAAEQAFDQLEQPFPAAQVVHNRGWIAALRGDVPNALRHFDDAEARMRAVDLFRPSALIDRAETLYAVGLLAEARDALDRAIDDCREQSANEDLGEAVTLAAKTALAQGDLEWAAQFAHEAVELAGAQQRGPHLAFARYLQILSAPVSDKAGSILELVAVADELERTGWVVPSVDVRLKAAEHAIDAGSVAEAEILLKEVEQRTVTLPALMRGQLEFLHAQVALSQGRSDDVRESLIESIETVTAYQLSLGASDFRLALGNHLDRLGAFGLGFHRTHSSTSELIGWLERYRASGLRAKVGMPEQDLAESALIALRNEQRELEHLTLVGADIDARRARLHALEADVVRAHRHASAHPTEIAFDPATLQAATDVDFVVVYGHLGKYYALQFTNGEWEERASSTRAEVQREVDLLRFALSRSARRLAPNGPGEHTPHASADAVFDVLFGGLQLRTNRTVVLSVPPDLLSVPWTFVLGDRCAAVEVNPSLALWNRARRTSATAEGITVAVGPDVRLGAEEASAIAGAQTDDVAVLNPAHTEEVIAAFAHSRVVHVAAHGVFRRDNPLFSSLRLHDGLLHLVDLTRTSRVPEGVVLSACQGALVHEHEGEQLLGMVGTLLQQGVRWVLASVAMANEDAIPPVMELLHGHLATGQPVGAALSQTMTAVPSGPLRDCARSFVVYGAS